MNRALTISIAAVAIGWACGGGSATDDVLDVSPSETQRVTVEVINQNFNDGNIYAVYSGGNRERLGTVGGNSRRTFTFRYSSGELRFRIDYIGGGSIDTPGETVRPGDVLELRLNQTENRFIIRR